LLGLEFGAVGSVGFFYFFIFGMSRKSGIGISLSYVVIEEVGRRRGLRSAHSSSHVHLRFLAPFPLKGDVKEN